MRLSTLIRLIGYFLSTATFFVTSFLPIIVYLYLLSNHDAEFFYWLITPFVGSILYLWALLYFSVLHTKISLRFLPKLKAGRWHHDSDEAKLFGVRLSGDGIVKAMLKTIGFVPFVNNKWFMKYFLHFYGLKCGKNVYLASSMSLDAGFLEIGDNCFFGQNCIISCHINESRYLEIRPVKIGRNVTIGGNTIVAPGSVIGDNVMIGVHSFIKKNQVLPPNSGIWAGVPVKNIKPRVIPPDLEDVEGDIIELVGEPSSAGDLLPVIDNDEPESE